MKNGSTGMKLDWSRKTEPCPVPTLRMLVGTPPLSFMFNFFVPGNKEMKEGGFLWFFIDLLMMARKDSSIGKGIRVRRITRPFFYPYVIVLLRLRKVIGQPLAFDSRCFLLSAGR